VQGEWPPPHRGTGSGEGAVPHPQKIFDYLLLKWRILHGAHVRYSDVVTYVF